MKYLFFVSPHYSVDADSMEEAKQRTKERFHSNPSMGYLVADVGEWVKLE
jgi:hypothetical protein